MFPQEDSLRLFCCHRGHNEETKSVEFAFVAISLRLTHHNDCTISRRMGYWKAEEFQKFCFPASEYIFGGILPDKYYHSLGFSLSELQSWFVNHAVSGMLYRIGEHILLRANEDEQQVICVTDFFTLCSCGQYYAFVKGELYASPEQDENHIYSGNPIVIPTSKVIITLASNILRKIMLYPDPDNIASPSCYVVIDFLRPHLPLCANDIIVPIYPISGDMIRVRGDDDDVWLAHVLSVDDKSRTCQIHFFVEDADNPGRYKRESLGRKACEKLHWDSILKLDIGSWEGTYWHQRGSAAALVST